MTRRLVLYLGSVLLLSYSACSTPKPSPPSTAQDASSVTRPLPPFETWRGPEAIGEITEATINEASGLAISQRGSEILWTHNDSGNEPVLYAIAPDGSFLGAVRIKGATNRDWEDIASCEIDGRAYLIAADIGDNNAMHPECVLYVIAEPEPAELSPTRECVTMPERIIRYAYPGGPRDCESLAVDISEQAIYLISKRAQPPSLYRLPLFPADTGRQPLTAEELGPVNGIPKPSGLLSRMPVPWGKWRAQPCSLDISPDGKTAALLTYGEVYLYQRKDGEDWASTFARGGSPLAAHNLPQAEAICFAPDGQSLYVTTEGSPAPLIRYTTRPTAESARQQ